MLGAEIAEHFSVEPAGLRHAISADYRYRNDMGPLGCYGRFYEISGKNVIATCRPRAMGHNIDAADGFIQTPRRQHIERVVPMPASRVLQRGAA